MSEVFISYARSTAAEAEKIQALLRAQGYRVWRDDEIPAHRAYSEVIRERLREAKAVVVIWSADAARSEWVRSEAERARGDQKLVQLTLDGAELPMPFDQIQCADLRGWSGDVAAPGWVRVLASIAALTAGAPDQTPAANRQRVSVCVLPFANMSGDPEQEYFSDGISEDIITGLSKVSALSVVSRNSAFQFKGRHVDVRQVGRQLGVSHVLEGSVRKAGQRVRVTAQLIEAGSDSHLWAERYDRDLTDIFALQDEISQAIVGALRLRLAPDEKRAIARRGTASPDAYNLYLMARQYSFSGNSDARGLETIVRLCHAATEMDPGYAHAWALMAGAQLSLHYRYGARGDTGMAAAEQALSLDPDLAEAHSIKGRLLIHLGRTAEASSEIETALRLDPESYEVNINAGYACFSQRRFEDACRHYEAATALVDTALHAPTMLISCFAAIGDAAGLERAAREVVARAERAVAQDQGNGSAMASGASALAALGESERARNWIARALLIDPDNRPMRYNLACALSRNLGDVDGAIEMLEPYVATATMGEMLHVEVDPDLDPLRADPRFQALIDAATRRLAGAA